MENPEPSFIQRLERMAPYVANRLLLIQGGIAVALALGGSPQGSVPEVLNFLPFSLGGVIQEKIAFTCGYPIRELIWAGEFWRLFIGAFLPPGLGIFILYWLALVPFGKALESRLTPLRCFLVYAAGGFATVCIDLVAGTGVTSGGIGMVFSAAGAVWVLDRLEPIEGVEGAPSVPKQNVLFLVLLGLICGLPFWGQPELIGRMAQLGITTLTPSLAALGAAFLVGVALGPFLSAAPVTDAPESQSTPPVVYERIRTRTLWAAPITATVGVLGYGAIGWLMGARTDHALWRIEPELLADSPAGTTAMENLVASNPNDYFLKKRLAVHHLRNARWDEAEPILSGLLIESATWTPQNVSERGLRALRVTHLNLRSSGVRLSWSYSGLSENYRVIPEWLLLDLAHLSRLKGDEESLTLYRRKALEENEKLIRAQSAHSGDRGGEIWKRKLESQILNQRAYFRAELGGNLALAVEEASRSVALDVASHNLDTLGWVQFKLGNLDRAIDRLRRSLQSIDGPSSGTNYYHLGAAYQESGDSEKAAYYFQEALRRDLAWWERFDIGLRQ